MKKCPLIVCICCLVLTSCLKNKSVTYPDFDYTTVYFASQYPVRTIELGEDQFVDNQLDNQHKFNIKATLGGTQDNKKAVSVDFTVVDTLCNHLYFSAGGARVLPMPANYYKLTANKISIAAGSMLGGVEVALTDAFFSDPAAIQNTYAIPLVMTKAVGVDSILKGDSPLEQPDRRVGADWTIAPKDYVIYAVKFVNEWHGNYLRRGKDAVIYAGETTPTDITRHATYVEKDEVNSLTTRSLNAVNFPVTIKDKSGTNIICALILKFDDQGKCVVTSATDGITVSGSGRFVKQGEKNSWGNQNRDAIYLDYKISMPELSTKTKDTLVLRDRGVSPEYFSPVIN